MTCPICNDAGYFTCGPWPHRYECQRCKYASRVPYAGVGPRETPNAVWSQMKLIGSLLGARGLVLRSGGAKPPLNHRAPDTNSADLAFEEGADSVNGATVIRTSAQPGPAMDHAAQFHPNWAACDPYARSKHECNSLIMCGDLLDQPVAFVVTWTQGGAIVGGTGQALRIAAGMDIPMFNLWDATAFGRLMAFIGERGW